MFDAHNRDELEKWVRRCQKGDSESWSKIVDRFSSMIVSIGRRAGLSQQDSEDLLQTTFIQLHKSLDRIENPATLPKWLSVTASREAYRIRRIQRSTNVADLDQETLEAVLADEDEFVDDSVIKADESDRLRIGLQALQEKCRNLLTALFLSQEPSYDEISARLGIPIGSIGPTRARCLDRLRSILSSQGFFADRVSDSRVESSRRSL